MSLRIRLRKQGKTNRPFYRLVLADVRSPRDGKYAEMLGWYNPFEEDEEKHAHIQADRVEFWLENGAQMSDKAEALVKRIAPDVVKKFHAKAHAKRLKKLVKKKQRKATAAK
jgi:small subunit ribosomal protein S16